MRRNNIKVIAIGGMIGVGKSTLVNSVLEKIPNSEVVYEIDPDDELTKQMLGFHHEVVKIWYGIVLIAKWTHLFPFRTQQLSTWTAKIVGAKIARCSAT